MLKMINRARNKKKGFTLIELIVVIAILGILAAILVPSMMGVVNDSKKGVNDANARSIYTIAQSTYVAMKLDDKTVPAATYTAGATLTAGTNEAIYMDKLADSLDGFDDGYTVEVGASGVISVTYGATGDTQGNYTP